MDINDLDKTLLYYLCSPYSSPNKHVQEQRYLDILHIGAQLTKAGFMLLEPIAMCHHQAQRFGLPTEYEFWKKRDRLFIDKCDAIIVVELDGWVKSKGVADEISHASYTGKQSIYLDPNDLSFKLSPH